MEMCNAEIKKQVEKMFCDLHSKSDDIVAMSSVYKSALDRIMKLVSSRIAAESEGYIVDMYTALVEQIKQESFFQDPNHLNAFYRLNLREKLNDKYHFEIDSLDAFQKGIDYKEINQLYVSLGTAAGTLAVGGILKFAISGVVNIPFAVIVAGAATVACSSYFKIVPSRNKTAFKKAVDNFLLDMESDILNWLADVENFFESQVKTLYSQD